MSGGAGRAIGGIRAWQPCLLACPLPLALVLFVGQCRGTADGERDRECFDTFGLWEAGSENKRSHTPQAKLSG